eukprot:159877-Rhodomonas_salina.1
MGNFGSKCKGVGREDSRLEEEGPQKKSGFYAIQDTFATVEEVQKALRKEGLESSNLIIGNCLSRSPIQCRLLTPLSHTSGQGWTSLRATHGQASN